MDQGLQIMPRSQKLTDQSGKAKALRFLCPGCNIDHVIYYEGHPSPHHNWAWNRDLEKPTIKPSIKVTGPNGPGTLCHSYVTDGQIKFLGDCTHALKDQTVDLPEVNDG